MPTKDLNELKDSKYFETELTVGKEGLDSLGHINHAHYLKIFEKARWQILEQKNLRAKLMDELNIGPVILEANVIYKSELKVQDEILIYSAFQPFKRDLIFKAQQSMHRKCYPEKEVGQSHSSELLATGEFTFGFMDLAKRKLTKLNDELISDLLQVGN